jgi:hypothetical protein
LFLFDHGTPLASGDIIKLLNNPKSQIYGGIPDWLYGVYACFACMVVFRIVHYFKLGLFSCTKVALFYVGFRFMTNLIYNFVSYPQSTVPYYLLLTAIAFDLLYAYFINKNPQWIGWFAITLSIVVCVYAVSLIQTEPPIHPPMPLISALAAVFSTMFGYGVASFLLFLHGNYSIQKELLNKEILT